MGLIDINGNPIGTSSEEFITEVQELLGLPPGTEPEDLLSAIGDALDMAEAAAEAGRRGILFAHNFYKDKAQEYVAAAKKDAGECKGDDRVKFMYRAKGVEEFFSGMGNEL